MVTDDPGEADRALALGEPVVLIAACPGGSVPRARAARLAVLIGDPADPASWAAAREMEQELFRAPPSRPSL